MISLLLLLVTIFVIGRKPTIKNVTFMICLVFIIPVVLDAYSAASQNTSIASLYLAQWDAYKEAYGSFFTAEQLELLGKSFQFIANHSIAIFAVEATVKVFVALIVVWAVKRARKTLRWSAFSKVDLPIASVLLLAFGCLLLALSNIPTMPNQHEMNLAAINVLIIAVIPLFVQGAAVIKALMNKKLSLPWQIAIVVLATLFGVLFTVLPVMGLVDFWANFRDLPRTNETASE